MNNINKRTEKRKLGDIGENIACNFLRSKGFEIIERNYLRKWGEIDIVAGKQGIMRFVEVKSISCVTLKSVKHETEFGSGDSMSRAYKETGLRPEENMHPGKLKRLARTMQTYMLHKKLDCDFQLDLVTVKIDKKTKQAQVELFENIVI